MPRRTHRVQRELAIAAAGNEVRIAETLLGVDDLRHRRGRRGAGEDRARAGDRRQPALLLRPSGELQPVEEDLLRSVEDLQVEERVPELRGRGEPYFATDVVGQDPPPVDEPEIVGSLDG